MEPFDYGQKKPDGQYEHHPSDVGPTYVQPIRHKYVHNTCGTLTVMRGGNLAETYATNPGFYTATFCVGCHDYFPLDQFHWDADGVPMNEVRGEPGKVLD